MLPNLNKISPVPYSTKPGIVFYIYNQSAETAAAAFLSLSFASR